MDHIMLKALQEIEIAKQRIESGDYIDARRRLLEVKRHVPALDDISGMIAVCDILRSADFGFLGCGIDHYWVLQVSPEATESEIKSQYKKFTNILEPLEDNFPGASSTLQVIEDAFLVLSNPEKRSMFGVKRADRLKAYESGITDADVSLGERKVYDAELFARVVASVVECIVTEGSSSCDKETKCLKQKWSMKDFTSDQIWAVYDGPDSMPRRYVVVNRVVSWSKVCVTFLEPYPRLDDEMSWVEENLPFACGLFRPGKTTLNLGFSQFSHTVKCEQRTQESLYKIYPKMGEIWAIYRNWNHGWKHADFARYECRIVETITDFSEESGLMAACLTEVPGRSTFFHRQLHDGYELIRAVPRTEMLSFSHQIPAFTVAGAIHGIPENSWHLEPDALPLKSSASSS